MGLKTVLRQYAFSVFVILCAAALLCGIIFVRERTQYNIDMTQYDKVEISRGEKGFEITVGNRKTTLENIIYDLF
ncbi:MAG: hypothetical protein IJ349_07295 [Clostridia bacterium]|nr:hypothetical protein [Clostridia bacterium]